MKKRKSAADIWQAQNVIPTPQEIEMYDLDDEEVEIEEASVEEHEPKKQLSAGLMRRRMAPSPKPAMPTPQPSPGGGDKVLIDGLKTSEEMQLEKEPIAIRETGFWMFKRVIIPPNAYVIHTRMGQEKPVTLGLGLSFSYNPYTDAYLVVPAAMQTIGVVANCISKEKQGINILAYVQWQIDDFSIAYRKLDFSDSRDPLGIVNAQLREQAEAAVKDKIATMSIEEVLTDKAPIIEELTTRLKAVSEGRQHGGDEVSEGLGIKIVTVQIREALVSSQRLWQDLQTPFRHQQEKIARMSSLTMQQDIHQKELETKRLSETRETETMVAIEQIKETKKTEALELRLSQEDIRTAKEQESIRQDVKVEEETTAMQRDSEERLQNQSAKIEQTRKLAALQRTNEEMLKRTLLETETKSRQKSLLIEQELHVITEENRLAEKQVESQQKRLGEEATLKKLESENRLALQKQEDMLKQQIIESEIACQRKQHLNELESEREKLRLAQEKQVQEVEIARLRQEVRNSITHGDLSQQLIEQLPEIAAHMPKVQELKVLQTGHDDIVLNALSSFLMKMMALIENLGSTSHKESQS